MPEINSSEVESPELAEPTELEWICDNKSCPVFGVTTVYRNQPTSMDCPLCKQPMRMESIVDSNKGKEEDNSK
jgi:hypothetical protein